MTSAWDDPANCPLRFNPPDHWRTPHPQWVSLYQGFEPPAGWLPYPDCPPAPPNWPFWEENGAAWFAYFQHFQPPPTRTLGWWFSLMALGMFSLLVIPITIPWPASLLGGSAALAASVVGVWGLIRQFRRQANADRGDPLEFVREWATRRREEWFRSRYALTRSHGPEELTYEEYVQRLTASWWGESDANAGNS